ncbi:hypothetical protein QQS45_07430 [Alteriqipengyuania flavescens]|jgi:hypothetical protein|nr:hypothetical protein [Alteriqipengyuania flavescens]WJY17497.1 hypothetical protein QQW98_07420 [Alteriqipengyuania flavescens]WJY23440.1 hypothetical protein QQS45_07430 [Alteriqipengyuania flavescens]
MADTIDPRKIDRAVKALRRAGFELEGEPSATKSGTVTFKAKVAE